MTLSISTLAAIQKVGAAAFSADAKLKAVARDYAERVSAAITENPDQKGNDTLIENWKIVARLSQTLEGIEEELKKVYELASQLTSDDQARAHDLPVVLAKPMKKKVTLPKVKVKAGKRKTIAGATKAVEPSSNPAKLLRHLEHLINANEFTAISQTAVARETGIPLGSMTAAIKKLVETGRLVTGPNSSLKLTMAPSDVSPSAPSSLSA